jgi:hypothetical protein
MKSLSSAADLAACVSKSAPLLDRLRRKVIESELADTGERLRRDQRINLARTVRLLPKLLSRCRRGILWQGRLFDARNVLRDRSRNTAGSRGDGQRVVRSAASSTETRCRRWSRLVIGHAVDDDRLVPMARRLSPHHRHDSAVGHWLQTDLVRLSPTRDGSLMVMHPREIAA